MNSKSWAFAWIAFLAPVTFMLTWNATRSAAQPAAPALTARGPLQDCYCPVQLTPSNPTCTCTFVYNVTVYEGVCTPLPGCSEVTGCRMAGITGWRCTPGGATTLIDVFDVTTECGGQITVVSKPCPAAGGGVGVGSLLLQCDDCTPVP